MFPGGFLVRQYGYRFSCALGATWAVLGYLLIGLGNYTKEFYTSYPYFMHLYFFVIGNAHYISLTISAYFSIGKGRDCVYGMDKVICTK